MKEITSFMPILLIISAPVFQAKSVLRWLSTGKKDDYCSVLCCVLKLCTVISTLRCNVM